MWTVTISFFPMVQWSKHHLWRQHPSLTFLTDSTVTKGGHREGSWEGMGGENPFMPWTPSELSLLFLWCGNYSCTGIPLSWKLQPYDNFLTLGTSKCSLWTFFEKTAYWLYHTIGICLLFFRLTIRNIFCSILIFNNNFLFLPQTSTHLFQPLPLKNLE